MSAVLHRARLQHHHHHHHTSLCKSILSQPNIVQYLVYFSMLLITVGCFHEHDTLLTLNKTEDMMTTRLLGLFLCQSTIKNQSNRIQAAFQPTLMLKFHFTPLNHEHTVLNRQIFE